LDFAYGLPCFVRVGRMQIGYGVVDGGQHRFVIAATWFAHGVSRPLRGVDTIGGGRRPGTGHRRLIGVE